MDSTDARVPRVDPHSKKTPSMQRVERFAAIRPLTLFLVHVGRYIDPVLMRWSDGRVNLTGTDAVLVLHHRGAKSGKPRQTPLAYFSNGRDVILVASKGGAPRHPAWFHNLRAHPDIELWVGSRGGAYRARVATAEERADLWPKAIAAYSGFEGYQGLTGGREIPIVICSSPADCGDVG